MSGTSISSWVQALLAEVRSQKEGEGAVECPLMRLSIVVGVKRDRLNELSTVDLPAGQLLKRISREVAVSPRLDGTRGHAVTYNRNAVTEEVLQGGEYFDRP